MDSLPSPSSASASNFNLHYLKSAPGTLATHVLLPPPPHHRLSATVTGHTLPRSSSSKSFGLTNSTQSFQSKASSSSSFQLIKPHKSRQSSPVPFRPPVHSRAASGYAAALIDAAQSNGTLAALDKDARRLSKLLGSREVNEFMGDRSVKDEDKGGLLKVVLQKGKFRGELQTVVNLLVDKGKFGTVWEVLDEFGRIYGELKYGVVKKMKGFGWQDKRMVGIGFAA